MRRHVLFLTTPLAQAVLQPPASSAPAFVGSHHSLIEMTSLYLLGYVITSNFEVLRTCSKTFVKSTWIVWTFCAQALHQKLINFTFSKFIALSAVLIP